ncbi:MAG: TlpA family protein disulfide reductase [Nocardioides sp.]
MSRAALAGVLLLLAAGCGDPEPADPGTPKASNVDVDTPALRTQKADAGIEECEPGTAPAPEDDAMPALTLACLGGGPDVRLDELRGPLVVNLFAQWCEPCRKELPYYQRLHQEGKGEVSVLGIDYLDTQPEGALALAKATGVTFPLLADPDGLLRPEFRIRGLPGVVLVDADGRVSRVEFTVMQSYAQLTALVEEHLGVTV